MAIEDGTTQYTPFITLHHPYRCSRITPMSSCISRRLWLYADDRGRLERRNEQFLLRAGGVREARRERLGAGERLGLVGGAELREEVLHRAGSEADSAEFLQQLSAAWRTLYSTPRAPGRHR